MNGVPYTCQFATSQGEKLIYEVEGRSEAVRAGFNHFLDGAKRGDFFLAGAHYLRFDIQVLFKDRPECFQGLGEIDFTDENGVRWKGSTNWPVIFAIARKNGATLLLCDTFRFFFGSLAKVANDLKIPQQKMARPPCVLENRFPRESEKSYFLEYAMQDAVVVLPILGWIDRIWEMENLGPCISIAHQAGRLFRRNHTRVDGEIRGLDVPDKFGQLAGISAAHGGRNSAKSPDKAFPFIVENCVMYDVRSMYPWICARLLPSFIGGRWVWSDNQAITESALYRVFGRVQAGDTHYKLLINDEGDYHKPGDPLFGQWLTGYELKRALEHGFIEDCKYTGYIWEPGPESHLRHPFREYFEQCFQKKEECRDSKPALYLYYKYLANSLTGKFIATIPQLKFNQERGQYQKIRVPGLLFNSPIGALITGPGRAYLFDKEIECSSLHGATDSFVVPPWGKKPDNVGKELGQLEEVVSGAFVCGRNKLYAFLGPETGRNITGIYGETKFWHGRKILKYANHGFNGSVFDFLALVWSGRRKYKYARMAQLRESQRRPGLTALAFNQFEAEVSFGGKYQGV